MRKFIAFINKSTKELIEVCPVEQQADITPNHGHDFYIVIVEQGRRKPTVSEVETELKRLRAIYPDETTEYTDEGGKLCESVRYGKYSEMGFCDAPWTELPPAVNNG